MQQGIRELTYNANYQPELFDTPLCQYRRLGQLLNGKGHLVAGGMNKGIFVIARRDNKQKLIEKRLPIDRQSQRRRSRAEIDALTRLLHAGPCDNINKIHESFFPGMTNYSCVILSFCELGSITDYINYKVEHNLTTPEPFAWHVLESIMRALTFCHYGILAGSPTASNGEWTTLCHLDVKPDNIWLTMQGTTGAMPRVVLGDFGCSVSPSDINRGLAHALMLTHGTPRWLPAEAKTLSHDGRGHYGKATDIWQAGATVQTMCRLTKSPDPLQAAARRPCGSTNYSRRLNSIVASCMEEEAGKRPSAIDCFQWVQENGPARRP
jgi:NIMA (never in mitosis gene a)-related kinase